MASRTVVELLLAVAAALLLARDVRAAWRDPLRRPSTLLIASLIAILLLGSLGGSAHPHPWWLAIPAVVLAWEVARGWRRTPRCHLWEAGIAAFAVALLLAATGFALDAHRPLLTIAALASFLGLGLLWRSRRREPRPWRAGDRDHYERRSHPR